MEPQLEEMHPDEVHEIKAHRLAVQEQLQRLHAPLDQRRRGLERKKAAYQFLRDVDDERMWIAERMQRAQQPNVGENLSDVHRLQKKNQSLKTEIDNHESWIQSIAENGRQLITEGHENSAEFELKINELLNAWKDLKDAMEERRKKLEQSEDAHRFLYDCNEAEAWMSEQELYMMQDERGKDEFSTENQIKKHERLQADINSFADTIRKLADRAQKFIDDRDPMSDPIAVRQSQIDKLYAGLQDLCRERRKRLDETLQLYGLHREIDDLLQWIAEREVVAASQELGQDYEHVQMLQERFHQFARDTESIGSDRVAKANDRCDALIACGHTDAPTVALWKDSLEEAWGNLLEMIDTRTQMLEESKKLHKFFHDCRDCLSRILEKSHSMPDDLGRDASSVRALDRKHQNFLKDLDAIEQQVKAIQEDARGLQAAYAGDKALEIQARESEVVSAWRNLHNLCETRRVRLGDTNDLFRFMNMVRDLLLWMDEVKREMNTQERPKDVSGVELLMNNHQSLKAEIDAREENFNTCISLGRDLLNRKHYACSEIEKKLIKLTTERAEMMRRWEDRWEYLQLILEVYQFARDAAVADAWLSAQEPYLISREYGRTLEEVIKLIKKHEAFEKSASAQEERFQALEKLTTYELKEMQRKHEEEDKRRRAARGSPPGGAAGAERIETTFPAGGGQETTLGGGEPGATPELRLKPRAPDPGTPSSSSSVGYGTPGSLDTSSPRLSSEPRGARLQASEPSGWRMSLSRAKHFDTHDVAGMESPDGGFEGHLIRKHTYESLEKKSASRSWDKLYCSLRGTQLAFYKDQKHKEEGDTYKSEPTLSLAGCSVTVAAEYTRKRHVLSLRLPTGAEYLFQCRDEDDMNRWLHHLTLATGQQRSEPSRSATMPEQVAASSKGPAKKGFFSLKKKGV